MPEITPLQRSDLPAAAALMQARLPGDTANEAFLEATLFDYPWADPELPSLVARDDDGRVVGFIGVQVRRLALDGRELRGVCCSHLVVAREGAGAAGALLIGRLLSGGQDLTWSDTAVDAVVRIWQTYGGRVDYARACDWLLLVSRQRWTRRALRSLARPGAGAPVVPLRSMLPQLATRHSNLPPPPDPDVTASDATSAELAAALPHVAPRLKLRVDYDAGSLQRLFDQIEASHGPLATRLVHRRGRPVGWYAYLPRPGLSRLLHLAADERQLDAVIAALVDDARGHGTAVLAGRLEPHLGPAVRRLRPALSFARQPIIHARDPELDAILAGPRALLTQLDGEWYAD